MRTNRIAVLVAVAVLVCPGVLGQVLNLRGQDVTDEQLGERLQGLSKLQLLSLDRTKVTDAGLEHLKGLSNLEWLYLRGTKVTNAGLEHLKGLSNLMGLGLVGTKVTDAGVQRLKEALPGYWIRLPRSL